MSEVTLATLAMEVSVPTADAAIDKLKKLRAAASELEGQAGKTATASKEQASAHGYMGTAAAQAEKTMRGLVEVYGTAYNASGRYVHSVEAEVSMILQNAKATAALAREQQAAAAQVARLTASYDPLAGAVMRTNNEIAKADALFKSGKLSAEQYATIVGGLKGKIDLLESAQTGLNKTGNTLRYTTLNLGRQFADIGTQLAGGQSPFLILVQQGPQIADAFATATAGGLTFKAVIAGLVTEAKALLLTFGPWIAAFAAVGGAIFVATKALSEHEKKVKDLYKAIDEQNKKLSESAPWLIKNSDNAYLAAEGQKNFEKYLAKTNSTLETQIKLLRAAAIEGLKKDLTEAQSRQKQAQTEFERISSANGRGSSPTGFTTNVGGFSTISAAPSRADIERTDGYKKALTEANKATDNVRIAQEKLNAALKVTPADYGAAFAGQASEAEKLAGALDTLLPKEKQIRDIRQQRAIVEQALAKGQISAAQAARAIAESEKQIAEIKRDPAADRALKAAQRKERAEAKKELAELVKAYEEPLRASEAFADALAKEVAVMGLSNEQQKRREIAMQAAAAPTAALAAQIAELGAQWEAQTKVAKEWTDIQAGVKAAANDNIRTFDEQTRGTIRFSSTLEKMAYDLEDAAAMSRGLRYDIEDIAYAINNNDWVSAFAGLVNVLAKVDTAFKNAKTSQDKFAAAAMLAQGVGAAVGGTGGAVVGGAGSGALAGLGLASSLTTLGIGIPGPGWALAAGGAVLGALGGLFGASKAKKRARQQAEAQRAAEEAQRQQTIADTMFQIEVDTLRANGKDAEATAKERERALKELEALSPALAEAKKAYYAAADAAEAASKAAERAAEIESKRASIQDQIDKLTLSDSELLAKTRAKERAEAVALDPTLGDLIDKLYGLQDSAMASEKATAALQAANDAATKAMEAQAAATQFLNDAGSQAIETLTGVAKSLREFAGELDGTLGRTSGYDAARAALLTEANSGRVQNLQALGEAFLKASGAKYGNSRDYQRDAAIVRAIALAGANTASERLSGVGAIFGNLPGFATGGSMVIGGNPGVDQNLLSLNGAPLARVGYGETLSVNPRGASNDNSLAELKAEFAAMRAQLADIAASNNKMERTLTKVTQGGRAMQTEAAS